MQDINMRFTGDIDAIGAAEPIQPGFTIGHNGKAAFGVDFLGGDTTILSFEKKPEKGGIPDRARPPIKKHP
jgi:hypothetical protein